MKIIICIVALFATTASITFAQSKITVGNGSSISVSSGAQVSVDAVKENYSQKGSSTETLSSDKVELNSFSSDVNGNNVSLKWSTAKDISNAGFHIERKESKSTEWIDAGTGSNNEMNNYSFSERVNTGKYSYRLKRTDENGNFTYYDLSGEVTVGIPEKYSLSQNYPNPFNPTTNISFEIPADGNVSLILFDISGREVMKLVNEVRAAGYYTVRVNASGLSSGMYFYRIVSGNFKDTKKMVILK